MGLIKLRNLKISLTVLASLFIFGACAQKIGSSSLSSSSNPSENVKATVTSDGTTWVYYNGQFNWGGDWSFGNYSLNYSNTSGPTPLSGSADIKFTLGQSNAGWQPYVSGNCQSNIADCFDTTAYQYLVFSMAPSVTGQNVQLMFHSAGDTDDGAVVSAAAYGPAGGSVAGVWGTYKIPLSAFKLTDTTILKFFIQGDSNNTGTLYLDNVGFTSSSTTTPTPPAPTPVPTPISTPVTSPVPTPPPITPPTTTGSTSWVYYNGVFNWGGDWSFGNYSLHYSNTSGPTPLSGSADIAFTLGQSNAGWQPYVSGNCQSNIADCFDTTKYKYLIFSMAPTVSGQVVQLMFHSAGDTDDGAVVTSTSYGPAAVAGVWGNYKIPLSAFKLTDTTILKFFIQGDSNNTGVIYLDNVGFTN